MAAGVKERQRLREQVGHQLVTEVAQDVLADLVGEPDAPVQSNVGNNEEDREECQGP